MATTEKHEGSTEKRVKFVAPTHPPVPPKTAELSPFRRVLHVCYRVDRDGANINVFDIRGVGRFNVVFSAECDACDNVSPCSDLPVLFFEAEGGSQIAKIGCVDCVSELLTAVRSDLTHINEESDGLFSVASSDVEEASSDE